jgi:hypothetical protein
MLRPENSPHAFAENFSLALTQVPVVDRRALSQAWYDALRLAQDSRSGSRRPLRAVKEPAPRHAVISGAGARSAPKPAGSGDLAAAGTARRLRSASRSYAGGERTATGSHAAVVTRKGDDLARKIIEHAREHPAAAHAVIDLPQGRVCVFVRRDRNGVRIVALCPPAAKLRVERALARARFALAGLGVAAAC